MQADSARVALYIGDFRDTCDTQVDISFYHLRNKPCDGILDKCKSKFKGTVINPESSKTHKSRIHIVLNSPREQLYRRNHFKFRRKLVFVQCNYYDTESI